MGAFWDRVLRAAKLEAALYEEVEADRSALGQAAAVVVLSSLAAAVGSSSGRLLTGVVSSLVGWGVWAYLTYWIGTKLLPEAETQSDPGELLRTLGFASAPGIVRVLGVVPGLGRVVVAVASLWMIAAMVVAVRQALDYRSTPRAAAVCLIGWVIQAVVLAFLYTWWGGIEAPG